MSTRSYTPPAKQSSGIGKKLAIAGLLLLLGVGGAMVVLKQVKESKSSQRYGLMLEEAAKSEVSEILMSGPEFALFLQNATNADTDEKQKNIMQALAKAKPNDGADLNATTAEFLTKTVEILPEDREALIREVLQDRVNPEMVPGLMEFARATKDIPSAVATFKAITPLAGDDQFEAFLSVLQFHPNPLFRQAAEDGAVAVIQRSSARSKWLAAVNTALNSSGDAKIKESLGRVKSAGGG